MIGLIPFLIDDFMISQCGRSARNEVLIAESLPADFSFSIAQLYEDDLCRRVITAMAIRIALPLPDLYDRLGTHFLAWIHEHLGGMFAGATDTTRFLHRLPAIYNSFGGSAAGAGLPGAVDLVTIRPAGSHLRVTYQSQQRFAAFFASFMKAVARHFNEPIAIEIVAGGLDAVYCVFDVAVGEAARSPHHEPEGAALENAFHHAG